MSGIKEIVPEEKEFRVLLFDIETSYNKGYCFGKYQQDIFIYEQESRLLSFAYKWLGTKNITCFTEKDFKFNNQKLVNELYKVIEKADIIVAHNAEKFDIRKINTFFLKYNLPPPPPFKIFDTKKFAYYKFGFNSNSLEDLCEYLGLGRKEKITEKNRLWVRLTERTASEKDWETLRRYNKRDVALLEKIYLKFRPYATKHPAIYVKKDTCPYCGSRDIICKGWSYLSTGIKRQRFKCKKCGKWSISNWFVRYIDKDDIIK